MRIKSGEHVRSGTLIGREEREGRHLRFGVSEKTVDFN